jgi:two-component system chemotaxis sensor kinase CheA
MGYEKLTHHYSTWQEEIEVAGAKINNGQDPDLAFMQMNLDEIVRVYPQAMEAAVSSNDSEKITETLDALFAEKSPADTSAGRVESVPASDALGKIEAALESALSDAFADEPLGGKEHDDKSAVLGNEALEEEYDTELLDVFIQQLKESIPFLHSQIADLAASVDKQGVLKSCSEAIKSLHSAANYMGYEKLTHHYTTWQEEIEVTGSKINNGRDPDLAFMQSRIDEIIGAYPQAMEDEPQKEISGTTRQAQETAAIDNDDEFEDITDTIDSMLSAPPVSADEVDASTSVVESQAEGRVAVEEEAAVTPLSDSDGEDRELFNKLSFALDASLEQAGNVPLKPMHGVIEEMITPSTEEVVGREVSMDKSPVATMEQVEAEAFTEQPDLQIEEERRQKERRQAERRREERRVRKETGDKKIKQSMRVDADKIDFMMNQVGELVVSRAYFAQLFAEMKGLHQNLLENLGLTKSELKPLNEFAFRLGEAGMALGRVSNELQDGVMKVRMLPIDQLFKRYPRLVRDLIHKTDKQIKLETKGEETELDKMVIEEISDPLIHIIRNAVDHGIETVAERKRLGKPESGTLILEAYHESDHIVIEVTDDGSGLDVNRVKATALAKGLHSSEELDRMSQTELIYLVMQPGFSTAEKTTKTSGRGVGMDVVKKNIEKLNGSVEIETKSGKGTRIRIKIPLTMAIIQALMVRVGIEKFTIPLRAVEETLRIFQQDISEIEGVDVIHIRNTTMPIFRLSRLFGIKRAAQDDEKLFVVVVKTGMQALGLVVDELLGQEEVVIKPLADYLRQESGFAGATILGDGGISLILDIPELVKMTTDNQVTKQNKLSYGRRVAVSDDIEQQPRVFH